MSSVMEKRKSEEGGGNQECGVSVKVTVLNRMARFLIEKLRFEQRPEGGEVVNQATI